MIDEINHNGVVHLPQREVDTGSERDRMPTGDMRTMVLTRGTLLQIPMIGKPGFAADKHYPVRVIAVRQLPYPDKGSKLLFVQLVSTKKVYDIKLSKEFLHSGQVASKSACSAHRHSLDQLLSPML
jgi:hypothetical protein